MPIEALWWEMFIKHTETLNQKLIINLFSKKSNAFNDNDLKLHNWFDQLCLLILIGF